IAGVTMDLIDLTIVNVALPTIRADLRASPSQLEWVISAYMLSLAALLIIAGSFGDLLGRKRIFLGGIAVFGAASMAGGLAQNPGELIAARVVQGVAAAAMIPQLLATFRAIFAHEERGKAFGIYGATLGFASAVGLIAGGALTDADLFGWRWRSVFLVNVPIALVTLVAAARAVPETRDPQAGHPDLAGATLLSASILAIAYPLVEGRSHGWPGWGWLVLAAGFTGLVALGLLEQRRSHTRVAPLLRPTLLRIPAFAAGLAVMAAFAAGLQGFFLILAVWLQSGMGFTPLRAGLTALAFSVGSFVLAPFAVPLARRYGRILLFSGGVLMALGTLAVRIGAPHVDGATDFWPVVPGLVISGIALSLQIIPLANVCLAAVPREVAGGAGGAFTTMQQLGGALGIAIVGTVFFGHLDDHTFTSAFRYAAPVAIALFVATALLSLALPNTALSEEELADVE